MNTLRKPKTAGLLKTRFYLPVSFRIKSTPKIKRLLPPQTQLQPDTRKLFTNIIRRLKSGACSKPFTEKWARILNVPLYLLLNHFSTTGIGHYPYVSWLVVRSRLFSPNRRDRAPPCPRAGPSPPDRFQQIQVPFQANLLSPELADSGQDPKKEASYVYKTFTRPPRSRST